MLKNKKAPPRASRSTRKPKGTRAQIHAMPRRGYVVAAAAESYGAPIRKAVALLQGHEPAHEEVRSTRSTTELAAWKLVSAWVVAVTLKKLSPESTLADALKWFGDCSLDGFFSRTPTKCVREAEAILSVAAHGAAVADLLPYILDPHGQASRLTVRKNPSTKTARARKKADGVFYTPADVANFMVRNSLTPLLSEGARLTVFDPACGTGVFLRTALLAYAERFPKVDRFSLATELLFGTDIDPWAVDACAFVLLHDCLEQRNERHNGKPIEMWLRLRENLACFDALLLDPAAPSTSKAKEIELSRRRAINDVLPRIGEGPRLIVGNPPYANLGNRSDLIELARNFSTFGDAPRSSVDVYPLFLEQMVRLAHPGSHGGSLVLPLSIASNTGRQFVATRKLISRTSGRWRFAFFDREPHALFGEDVKTRNAIVLWDRSEGKVRVEIHTGPLRKWRGQDRAAMFNSIDFTLFRGDITEGIPKLSGSSHAQAWSSISGQSNTLMRYAAELGRAELSRVPKERMPAVFVGATAYNFINAFRKVDATILDIAALSEHPLHALRFACEQDASIAYAVLSSCYTYWWWHVNDDGFHVSRSTLSDLPVGRAFSDSAIAARLSLLGRKLWTVVQERPIRSINKGKVSLGFNPSLHTELRNEIDRELMKALDLEEHHADELAQFCCQLSSASVQTLTEGRK